MTAPRFVTSDKFGAPGVYIKEVPPPATVQGETLNMIGIGGVCVKGPVDQVVEVTSYGRFKAIFGGRDHGAGGSIVGEIWKALINKPFSKLAIVRVAPAAGVPASKSLLQTATPVLSVAAASKGTWGNNIRVDVEAATDGTATKFNLRATWLDQVQLWENLNINSTDNNLAQVMGNDPANLVTATKLANGRPDNIALQALDGVAGTDGAIADSDFTAAGKAIELLANYKGIKAVFIAGRSNSAIKASLVTKAGANHDRDFLACPDASNTTIAAAKTERAGLTGAKDRMTYCFNHPTTLDPETAETITVEPHSWMAAILSQTDDDVHPAAARNIPFLAGITGLSFPSLALADYDDLSLDGIAALENDEGYKFNDAPQVNRTQLPYRLMKDFILRSVAPFVKSDINEANTQSRRDARKGGVSAWLLGLFRQERYVGATPDGKPGFVYDPESLNTQIERDNGVQKDLMRVKLVPFNRWIQLVSEMGTTVKFTMTDL